MSTTTDRNTLQQGLGVVIGDEWPVLTATKIPAGVLVARDTSGYAKNATDAASLTFAGVAKEQADNTDGATGDITVKVHTKGRFKFAAAATYTAADIGKQVYVSDNETVAVAAPSHSLKCGRLIAVDASGDVWVEIDADVNRNAATS